MDTNEFLGRLRSGLEAQGLPKEKIMPKLTQMSEYLASLPDAEREKELSLRSSDLEKVISNLAAQCREEPDVPAQPDGQEDDVRIAPDYTDGEIRSRRTMIHRTPTRAGTAAVTRVSPPVKPEKSEVIPAQGTNPAPRKSEAHTPVRAKEEEAKEENAAYTRPVKFSELDQVAVVDKKNQILFWVVFVLTLPLTLAILLLILGVFAAVFLAFASVIALCVGALVGITAAGSIVSLFGLVYGVTQLFTCPPAGMYEIGFAVKIAGVALFGGIVFYNIAIRLIPWIMKLVYQLLTFVARKISKLFLFIRRECTGK